MTFRCAHEIFRRRSDKTVSRACPACNKILSSRLHLCGENSNIIDNTGSMPRSSASYVASSDGRGSLYRSNLSLASLSLRASSLTINSDCHATSSV